MIYTYTQRCNRVVGFKGPVLTLASAGLLLLGACVHWPDTTPPDIDVSGRTIDQLLDRYTDSHRDADSNMGLLIDGPDSYAAFMDLIESAEDHINIETLNFDDDSGQPRDLSMEFARLLADKARAGVQVNLIIDPVMQLALSSPEIVMVLTEGGVNYRDFVLPGGWLDDQLMRRTHKKILLVDGRRAIIGGMNYGWLYFAENQWRDTNVLVTGPVVATVQREFLRDWGTLGNDIGDRQRYFPELEATGDLAIRAIDQRPTQGDIDLNAAILIALRSADLSIDIEAPYFNPTEWLAEELLATSARGVEVRILVNSDASLNVEGTFPMTAYWFDAMLDGGVRMFMWDQGVHRTMHSKAIVVDSKMAMVSTHNLNLRSLVWDAENGVIFTDPEAIDAVRAMVEADFAHDWVIEVDRAWLDAVPPEERASWDEGRFWAWLF